MIAISSSWFLGLQGFALILVLIGALTVFFAPYVVRRRMMEERVVLDPQWVGHHTEEEIRQQRRRTAILQVKIWGIVLLIPGALLYLILQALR